MGILSTLTCRPNFMLISRLSTTWLLSKPMRVISARLRFSSWSHTALICSGSAGMVKKMDRSKIRDTSAEARPKAEKAAEVGNMYTDLKLRRLP